MQRGDLILSNDLPKKLRDDAIVEALFEVRFDIPSTVLPELFFGRLADTWNTFSQQRLPSADIPAAMRRFDPNLRFQPSIELRDPNGKRRVRIGPYVFSYHQYAPYPGWESFGSDLKTAIDAVMNSVPKINVHRLGLRYINALRSDIHGVTGPQQLNLDIQTANHSLTETFNLNYRVSLPNGCLGMVRIATRDLIEGVVPDQTSIVIDIDVSTPEPYETTNVQVVKDWIDCAHIEEKRLFFNHLKKEIVDNLRMD
jgi:uncharacterized protein (TIGR04255 family)